MELHLSKDNWWQEIEDNKDLPQPLKGLLRSLISATKGNLIPPDASEDLVRLAKKHLQDTLIWIGERLCYSVMVYVPKDKKKGRTFFLLACCYPDGELKRLSEL